MRWDEGDGFGFVLDKHQLGWWGVIGILMVTMNQEIIQVTMNQGTIRMNVSREPSRINVSWAGHN
jgi:hypothetical protein